MDLNEQLRRQLRVEYFRPVRDVISTALADRFNDDCIRILRNMPAVFAKSLNEKGIESLANLFDLDGELCFSEAKVMMIGENNEPKEPYKDIGNLSADDAV